MFNVNDQQPHKVVSRRGAKSQNVRDALFKGKGAVTDGESVTRTPLILTPSRAANDASFWSGGNRDFT